MEKPRDEVAWLVFALPVPVLYQYRSVPLLDDASFLLAGKKGSCKLRVSTDNKLGAAHFKDTGASCLYL
jgi:hypothetical protein